jgi:5-enolpyruvylshikimate-3-phosphate synthase
MESVFLTQTDLLQRKRQKKWNPEPLQKFWRRFHRRKGYVYIKKSYSVDTPSELYFDDHRMIMAGIVAGIASGKSVIHNNVENIAKSYPQFLDTIQSLGAEVEYL